MVEQPYINDRAGIVILAAGKGTRMHSQTPKVLQQLLGEPMLGYVHAAAREAAGGRVRMVIGHGASQVRAAFPDLEDKCILQEEQRGTGHALMTAWPFVQAKGLEYVVVLNGDTPLIGPDMLRSFMAFAMREEADVAFVSLRLESPGDYGRVLRRKGRVAAVVEAKDYDVAAHGPDQGEVNAGIYCFKTDTVGALLPSLSDDNAGGEFYITDLIGLAARGHGKVVAHNAGGCRELMGVNNPAELALAEECLRAAIVQRHADDGVIIRAAQSVRIGPHVQIAPGADITGPCELYGKTVIEAGARVSSHCVLRDSIVAAGAVVRAFSHLERAHVGPGAMAGPYARLRPGAVLEEGARAGNFVEVKKARIGKGSKASHLSYIGDAEVGRDVNIGAGTITCNYDGRHKHETIIGDGAFIGSNTALVAPVRVGAGALVGAGSVITKDVPDNTLGITRAMQKNLPRRPGRGQDTPQDPGQDPPQSPPQGSPQATPQGPPQGSPQGTPQGSPQATPQSPPQGTPQGTPGEPGT